MKNMPSQLQWLRLFFQLELASRSILLHAYAQDEEQSQLPITSKVSYTFPRLLLHFLLLLTIGSVTYGMYWLMQQVYRRRSLLKKKMVSICQDSRRQRRMKNFMQDATIQLGRSQVPQAVVQTHLRLRKELFNKHAAEAIEYASIEDADEATKSSGDYSGSWQRSLPSEAKQELKAAVLRRTVAIIPRFDRATGEFEAKATLFDRRLIADVHWQSVKREYEAILAQLKFMMFEADCIEENWGSAPNGLVQTAAIIARHELVKEKEEMAKQVQAKEVERQKQREMKEREVAKKEEEKRFQKMLEEEGVTIDSKKKPKKM